MRNYPEAPQPTVSAQVTCGLCEKGGKEFTVPIDEIGVAVMKQHLASEHGITVQVP